MILLIDNYDSFVHNLARYFERLGQPTRVVRNDAIGVDEIERLAPAAVVLSPGPCTPSEAGCSLDVVRRLAGRLPILGICLGHQAIGAALGGRVVRASEPVHGRASAIFHAGGSLFAGLPGPLTAARYHSLVVERSSLPAELEVTAWTADGTIMALAHRHWPVVGLQFHPESILTDCGYELLASFLRLAGVPGAGATPTIESELAAAELSSSPLPTAPVTF
jgi:anthranilate synthase/aminodeoxychorismate synthase-like glutamine amidotransferase